jgi:penicillin-insensitive murein endopeptidase
MSHGVPLCTSHPGLLHVFSCSRGIDRGTRELVDLLVRAGRETRAAFPDVRMVVGNLSRDGGGPIAYSQSHQSGRDADLGLILLDERGRQFLPLPLVKVGRDGRAQAGGRRLAFDAPRNWAMVRLLVIDPGVQWVFVADWLKRRLLEQARAAGEPPDVLIRAAYVLHQPSDSTPHDDHYHVRVFCSPASRFAGCLERGPAWSWADGRSPELEEAVRGRVQAWREGSDREALEALRDLTLWARDEAVEDALRDWPQRDPLLAEASRAYLKRVDLAPWAALALDQAERGLAEGWGAALLPLLRRVPARLVDAFLVRAAARPGLDDEARRAVLRFARRAGGSAPLLVLLNAWSPLPRGLQAEVLDTAHSLLNRRFSSLPQLSRFLEEHQRETAFDLALAGIPGVCVGDRLDVHRVVGQIRLGGFRRDVALHLLERLFPSCSFPEGFSDERLFHSWVTVVDNAPPRPLPCTWSAIRRSLEGS